MLVPDELGRLVMENEVKRERTVSGVPSSPFHPLLLLPPRIQIHLALHRIRSRRIHQMSRWNLLDDRKVLEPPSPQPFSFFGVVVV